MDLREAKVTNTRRKKRRRIGRGEGSGYGKTSGRGMDGARSRSGWSQRNMTGGNIPLWRRLPKVGFTNAPFRKDYNCVNIERLAAFEANEKVTPESLKEKGIVGGHSGAGRVKVLGNGEIDRPLTVCAHKFSVSAREKIEAAGGSCEVIPGPRRPVRNRMKQKPSVAAFPGEEESV